MMASTNDDTQLAAIRAQIAALAREGNTVRIEHLCGHREWYDADLGRARFQRLTGELCTRCTLLAAYDREETR